MPSDELEVAALRPWQVRVIIACIAAVPLLLASTLFDVEKSFWRDLIKDFGVVMAGLLVVNLVWSIVGGEPLENEIKALQQELRRTKSSLAQFSALTNNAQKAGLTNVGADSSALFYQPEQLLTLIEHSKERICLCGLTLLLLHENYAIVAALVSAAKRGVAVQILLPAHDNQWLEASNRKEALPGMSGVIQSTFETLKRSAAEAGGSHFTVALLRSKTMTLSILRFDELMIATPYLISTMTPSSPRFVTTGSETPLFKVWMREFDHLFKLADVVS